MIRSLKWHVAALVLAAACLLSSGRASAQSCFGDCNGNGSLTASDIGRINSTILRCSPCAGGVAGGVAVGCPEAVPAGPGCLAADFNTDGCIRASELGRANQNILRFPPNGCAPEATATMAPAPTATPTGGGGPAVCGDMVVQDGEDCDDGGACRNGTNNGDLCDSDGDCTGGGTCEPFGADGCAANCTTEKQSTFTFTGAKCFGGEKDGQLCTFAATCVGGNKPGRPCGADMDCFPGTCVSECGAGGNCFGDGECSNNTSISCAVGGPTNPCPTGGTCLNKSRAALISIGVPILIGPLIGKQTSYYGKPGPDGLIPIANPSDETDFEPVRVPGLVCACVRGGADANAHGPGNSGSGVINCGAGTIANDITLGADHSTAPPRMCIGGTNDGMPCTPRCNAGGTRGGQPCRILGPSSPDCPGTSAAQRICTQNVDCPSGACTVSNGPGVCSANSQNAGRACFNNTQCTGTGAVCEGLCVTGANVGATCSCPGTFTGGGCDNTAQCGADGRCSVTGTRGGGFCLGPPKFCVGGTSPGKACFNASECGGGTCPGTGSFLSYCNENADCPGSVCNSIDDPGCDAAELPPPAGSGDTACRESREICVNGANIGQPCTASNQCGAGATANACSNSCNANVAHVNACNSPTRILLGGQGGTGSALLLSTTAIGTISDGGSCGIAARCANQAPGTACVADIDCTSGVCATALCAGTCSGGTTPGKGCITVADCVGAGSSCNTVFEGYNTECTQPGPCGNGGTCLAVDAAKGLDGLPCTADDATAAQGTPQTIPQTTGRSATFLADADNIGGAQLVHLACIGGLIDPTTCASTVVGTPFDCANVMSENPSPSGVRLANTFPTLDGQTGDGVVSTFLTAR